MKDKIETKQHSIKELFEIYSAFQIPEYQRGYAWDENAIKDFIDDLGRCLKMRKKGKSSSHFLGGIVTVKQDIEGAIRANYEVIDGQQRLASFVMLVAAIVYNSKALLQELEEKEVPSSEEKRAKRKLKRISEELEETYLGHKNKSPKLKLSDVDDEFFQKTIQGKQPASDPEAYSHELIKDAWEKFQKFTKEKVFDSSEISEKPKAIKLLINGVLSEDCTVILMCSKSRTEAYQIFQILNDRGVSLTNGDLLRVRTLQLLNDGNLESEKNKVNDYWNSILTDSPKNTEDYLLWYFSSFEGRRPRSSDLVSQFLEKRFSLNNPNAQIILKEMESLDKGFKFFRKVNNGKWPYEKSTVKDWNRKRLYLLITHLKHTHSMPLLLSLYDLGEKQFLNAIQIIEKFIFRYKTIGNAHIGPVARIYFQYSKAIRESGKFRIKKFRDELKDLVEKEVPSTIFKDKLRNLEYLPRGGNQKIRYLLTTLEDYFPWYKQGARGVPKCHDKMKVFDYPNVSIEHIYSQSVGVAERIPSLESVKNRIGNLTILSQEDNIELGNIPPSEKQKILSESSSLELNQEIGQYGKWTVGAVRKRRDSLINMALKVFVL